VNNRKWIWLLAVVIILPQVGCNRKTEMPTETAKAPEFTPIDPSTVGGVTGKVLFAGARPQPQRIVMDQDPACTEKQRGKAVFAEDGDVNDNQTLPNAFVYVKTGAEKYAFTAPADPVVLDQEGCMYKPHVLGLMVGQTLKIVSSDPTTHNIHPMPKYNREWNLSQLPGAEAIQQRFRRPEIMVPIKCNQHNWMHAWIGVTSNPFFAVTGRDGTFTLKGLPPGDYTLEAWTASFGTQEQKVTVGAKETKKVEFAFKAL